VPSDNLQHIQFEGCDVCVIAPEDYDALQFELTNLRLSATARDEALREAEAFVDRHSEPWYTSGQELLAKIRAALEAK
jgi:ABC-type amino acid transport substrate-binding protein